MQSSGFDVLDTATCTTVMAKAQFNPALDAAGKPVTGLYANRVRWAIPHGDGQAPDFVVGETMVVTHIVYDRTGQQTSCKVEQSLPALPETVPMRDCPMPFPSEFLRMVGSKAAGVPVDLQLVSGDAFTPALRAKLLEPRPGFEQLALTVHSFTVGPDGKMTACVFEQQRGNVQIAMDFCPQAQAWRYDPPFSALGKDGLAKGWHIMRLLAKVG